LNESTEINVGEQQLEFCWTFIKPFFTFIALLHKKKYLLKWLHLTNFINTYEACTKVQACQPFYAKSIVKIGYCNTAFTSSASAKP